jgi:hypothetical protein
MPGARVLPLVLGVLGACVTGPSDPGYGYPDPGGDPYPYPGGTYCTQASDCGSAEVCAETSECLSPSEVRTLHIAWTVSGQAAGSATCANAPDLQLMLGLDGYDYSFGWAPVPCVEGKFTVLNMPNDYTTVALIRENDPSGGATGVIDGSGDSNLDLPY